MDSAGDGIRSQLKELRGKKEREQRLGDKVAGVHGTRSAKSQYRKPETKKVVTYFVNKDAPRHPQAPAVPPAPAPSPGTVPPLPGAPPPMADYPSVPTFIFGAPQSRGAVVDQRHRKDSEEEYSSDSDLESALFHSKKTIQSVFRFGGRLPPKNQQPSVFFRKANHYAGPFPSNFAS